MYFIIIIFFMILSIAVSQRLKSKFRKYSRIRLSNNLSGREIAELMLADHGIYDVRVQAVPGKLTDHYNPGDKTINLSPEVYEGRSAAAAAVAAHECGHAVQHAKAYSMLEFRSTLVPLQNISGRILNFLFLAMLFGGIFFLGISYEPIILIIIGCYFVLTLFSFVTLPVEFDASKRALAWIEERNIVNAQEHAMAKDALKWAAMTYVVAAIGSLVTLMYWILALVGGDE